MSQGNTSLSRRSSAADADSRRRRLDALLRRVAKKPSLVLSDRRCLKRRFCERFFELRQRVKDLRGWTEVLRRLSWVDGQVCARLGERKNASKRFDRLFEAFLGSAPPKHALAVAIDRSLLLARRASDVDIRAILGMIGKCQRLDLEAKTKKRLREVKRIVSQQPEKAAIALGALRSSFIVPVPGLLSEAGRLRCEVMVGDQPA